MGGGGGVVTHGPQQIYWKLTDLSLITCAKTYRYISTCESQAVIAVPADLWLRFDQHYVKKATVILCITVVVIIIR